MPQFGGAAEKCSVCAKTVYLAEKIVVEDKEDKKTFHKACLRCSHCKVILSLGNYASMQGVFYCKPHFKQLFATKGNYDEGFGKDKHSKNWTPQAVSAHPASFVPVDKDEQGGGGGGGSGSSSGKKETPTSIASKFGRTALNTEKCHVCNKTVYATEKTVIEEKEGKKVFHKTCLKCSHCNVIVTLGNYASMQGVVYCKPHFKQLFAAKGNYDEGFGKEKASSKWEPQASTAPATFVPVDKDDGAKEKRNAPENIASRFKGSASNTEKCSSCGKTVYLTERIVVEDKEDKQTFHKSCLRCSHCQAGLTLGNYASMQGVMYCKPHFKQLFATKGNYDEGFGKEKHTKKWIESKEEGDSDSRPDSHRSNHSDKEQDLASEQELEKEIEAEKERENARRHQQEKEAEKARERQEKEEEDRLQFEKKRAEERKKEEREEREREEREERDREEQEQMERRKLEREQEEQEEREREEREDREAREAREENEAREQKEEEREDHEDREREVQQEVEEEHEHESESTVSTITTDTADADAEDD